MFNNLPLHPLLVHAPVVLLPLTALGVILLVFLKKRERQVSLALIALIAAGVASAVASVLSGNYLASIMYTPTAHQRWGFFLMITSVVYLLVAAPWLWLISAKDREPSGAMRALGYAAALSGIVVTGLTVATGHSGAELNWSNVGSEQATAATSSGPVTMEQIAQHNKAEDCWVAIDGNAYDLTEWVSGHPGGAGAISSMCGTDGTAGFQGKHGNDDGPAKALEQYLLGPVA